MKKLRNNRGETLVEVLASILVASLSVALLFGCVMASTNMDRDAKELDAEHYRYLSEAEAQSGAGTSADVTITNEAIPDPLDPMKNPKKVPVNISIYGGAGVYSYKKAAGS